MPLLVWREQLNVGAEEIDEDHKRLVGFVNDLSEAIERNQDEKVVGRILLELIEYTRDHFAREEKVMAAAGYPHAERHKKIHRALTRQVMVMSERYVSEPSHEVTRELIDFLSAWLVDHIIKEDRQIGAYLRGKRVWL